MNYIVEQVIFWIVFALVAVAALWAGYRALQQAWDTITKKRKYPF